MPLRLTTCDNIGDIGQHVSLQGFALAGNGAAFAKMKVSIEGPSKVFERDGDTGRKVRFYSMRCCGTSRPVASG